MPIDFNARYEELKKELKTCENELKRLTFLRKTIVNPKWLNMALSLKYRLKDLKKPQADAYLPNVEQDMLSEIESLKIQLKQMYLLPHDVKEVLNEYINLKSATPFPKCYLHKEKWTFDS